MNHKKFRPFIRATSFSLLVIALLVMLPRAAAHPGRGGDWGEFGGFPGESVGEPGPLPPESPRASSKNIKVLGHADPGGGFNGDVVAHQGFAYLGSWGAFEDESVDFCPSQGVRVYSLRKPANP